VEVGLGPRVRAPTLREIISDIPVDSLGDVEGWEGDPIGGELHVQVALAEEDNKDYM